MRDFITTQDVRTQVWQVDPHRFDYKVIREAAAMLQLGKLVIFPTETVYGLAAAISRKEAIDRIYELKKRPLDKPLTWHVVDYDYLTEHGIHLSPFARELSWRFLPGPLTLLVPKQGGETVGLRFPDHPIGRALIDAVGEPVLATSVNESGEEAIASGKKAARLFNGRVDLVLDSGVTHFGTDSTIIDLTKDEPVVLRRGPLANEVEEFIKVSRTRKNIETEHILFVCTGNTCRSVMASGWLTAELKRKKLDDRVSVTSCGTGVNEGDPATLEAIQTVRSSGGEISGHRARPVTKKILQDATKIFAMTSAHVDVILSLDYKASSKVTVLGVNDPLGSDAKVYKDTLEEMKQKLRKSLPWLVE